MKFLKTYKIEGLIFLVVVSYLFVWFGVFCYLDRSFGDIDGVLPYSFPVYGSDASRYITLAENMIKEGVFSVDGKIPEVFRTPGYPALLAFSKILFGNFSFTSFFTMLFSGVLSVLVYLIGRKLLSVRLSIIAALFFSLFPNSVFHSIGSFGEIPFTFFLILAFWLSFFKKERSRGTFFLAGVSIGVSALIRPITFWFPLVFLPFLFFEWFYQERIRVDSRKFAYSPILFLVGFFLIVSPWLLRNKIVGGEFSLSSIGSYNLAQYNAPLYLEYRFGVDSPEVSSYREKLGLVSNDEGKTFEEKDTLTNLALESIQGNKFSYFLFHITETSKFFLSSSLRYVVIHINIPVVQKIFGLNASSSNIIELVRHYDIKKIMETLATQIFITFDRLIVLGVTILALFAVFFKKVRFFTLLFLSSIFYFAILSGPVSIPRYRLPVEPLIIILAFYVLQEVSSFFKSKKFMPVVSLKDN